MATVSALEPTAVRASRLLAFRRRQELIVPPSKPAAVAELPADLRTRVDEAFNAVPARSWHAALRGLRS